MAKGQLPSVNKAGLGELFARLRFVLLAIFVYRIGTHIPVPGIDPDQLASKFARRYDPNRGYGGGAHDLLQSFQRGVPWRLAAPAMFGGTGSYGNGSAMRVAPLGAFFAEDHDAVVEQADRV